MTPTTLAALTGLAYLAGGLTVYSVMAARRRASSLTDFMAQRRERKARYKATTILDGPQLTTTQAVTLAEATTVEITPDGFTVEVQPRTKKQDGACFKAAVSFGGRHLATEYGTSRQNAVALACDAATKRLQRILAGGMI